MSKVRTEARTALAEAIEAYKTAECNLADAKSASAKASTCAVGRGVARIDRELRTASSRIYTPLAGGLQASAPLR